MISWIIPSALERDDRYIARLLEMEVVRWGTPRWGYRAQFALSPVCARFRWGPRSCGA
jgi:hypothetical protein